jgi:hypothetical protein
MIVSHGEGPWHGHGGPYQRPTVSNLREGIRARFFSPARNIAFGHYGPDNEFCAYSHAYVQKSVKVKSQMGAL